MKHVEVNTSQERRQCRGICRLLCIGDRSNLVMFPLHTLGPDSMKLSSGQLEHGFDTSPLKSYSTLTEPGQNCFQSHAVLTVLFATDNNVIIETSSAFETFKHLVHCLLPNGWCTRNSILHNISGSSCSVEAGHMPGSGLKC